jgi:Holliday junction resolvase
MTPEGKIKKRVTAILDATKGVYYFFPAANGFGRTAIPDIIGCVRGRFFAIECKAGSKTATALQNRELMRIGVAGGTVIVINAENIDTFEQEFNRWGR